jgi:hypothetical protein
MAAFRFPSLMLLLAFAFPSLAQVSPSPTQEVRDLKAALSASWTGILEYRDYSEPPTSTKRVQLPTWLTISDSGPNGQIVFHYIYDDGPNKVVDETDLVSLDPNGHTWASSDNGKPAQTYTIEGTDKLKGGRGQIILTGTGMDNGKPTEQRITLQIRRNLLVIKQEARPTGSTDEFAFRHQYVFTRAQPPAVIPVPQ